MKKIIFSITIILSLAAFSMMGCKGEVTKDDLRGSWQITECDGNKINELVLYSFGDSVFYIDEQFEGCEFYYYVSNNKIYYTEKTSMVGFETTSDSMTIISLNDSVMNVVWFNPTQKRLEEFKLKYLYAKK